MLSTVHGIYKKGKVELSEPPPIEGEVPVIITFLKPESIDLKTRGIDEKQASELRARLDPFAEEWMSPEMDAYDTYDKSRASTSSR